MIQESDISRFLHSRYALIAFALIAIITTYLASSWGKVTPILDNKGLGLTPINQWFEPGRLSLTINIFLNFLIALLMIYINKTFNVLRNPTILFAGLFLILQIPITDIMGQLYGGTMLCVVMLICTFILFSTYNDQNPYAIFLIFAILSLGTFFQYAFIFYVPVFVLGCMQMRILDLRIAIAAILGLITPPWILFGFGILDVKNIALPQFIGIYEQLSMQEVLQMLITIGLSIFVCIGAWFANIVNIISYNAKTRAYNGVFAILALTSILLIMADYTNYIIYVPMLNCCTALQLGHLFTIYEARRSYIGIISVFVVYLGLYIWGVWI